MDPDITTTAAFKAAEVYEWYFVANKFRYWTPLLLDRATPRRGEHVLDIACGTGVVARSVVPRVRPGGRVVGLDRNPSMLAVACRQFAENCGEIDWREGRAEKLPFTNGMFDLTLCQQGLQFFSDRPAAAREMRRVLRPGGRAALAVWTSIEDHPVYVALFEAIASVFDVPLDAIATAFSFGDPHALKSLLAQAGFERVAIEKVDQSVYMTEPERFVELTIKGAAVVIPEFARLDDETISALQAKVTDRIAGVLDENTHDGVLSFPMHANIAVAVA